MDENLRQSLDALSLDPAQREPARQALVAAASQPQSAQALVQEGLATFLSQLAPPAAASTVAAAAAVLAEACKQEAVREWLGSQAPAMKAVVLALADTVRPEQAAPPAAAAAAAARVQLLRLIGNLCYDHEANRQRLRQHGGIQALAAALHAVAQPPADGAQPIENENDLRAAHLAAPGAIANAAAGEAEQDEALKQELVEHGTIESLVWLLQQARSAGERRLALASLSRFSNMQAATVKMGPALPTLVRMLEEARDEESCNDLVELLRAVTAQDAVLPHLADNATLQKLMDMAEDDSRLGPARTMAAGTFSVALSDDRCQALLWQPQTFAPGSSSEALVQRLLGWINSEDSERRVAGAIALGNLCRNDASAAALGSVPHLIANLLAMLEARLSFVQHAGLGAAKNLCRLPANRPQFLTASAYRQLLHVLNDPQGPLQMSACSIVRTLFGSVGAEAFVRAAFRLESDAPPAEVDVDGSRRASAEGAAATDVGSHSEAYPAEPMLPRLLHLSESEMLPVRAEASRAIAAAVKAMHNSAVLTPVADAGVAKALVRMAKEPHPLLQTEATVAMAVLAACGAQASQALIQVEALPLLAERLEAPLSASHSPEALCNEMTVAHQLYRVAPSQSSESQRIASRLKVLAKDAPVPFVKAHAEKLAAAL